METKEHIKQFIKELAEPKSSDIHSLHEKMVKLYPSEKLWFFDGKNVNDKTVTNPTIGYGHQIMTYAKSNTREFFRVGISANTTGISVYLIGLKDKKYLADTFGQNLGKASISGYCIKFKSLKDIDVEVLLKAIDYGMKL